MTKRHDDKSRRDRVSVKAIARAKKAFPDLTMEGFGGDDRPFHLDNISTAIAFLSRCRPTKRPTCGSYNLKHIAERWGRSVGLEPYIANGELIVAAVALGFVVKPDRELPGRGLDNPNAGIGVYRRDLVELQEETRARSGWYGPAA